VVIPFTIEIAEDDVDDEFPEKLAAEAPGILAWPVKGCTAWQEEGLNPPPTIKRAMGGWQKAVDHVDRFVREELVMEEDNIVRASAMYTRYKAWCAGNGETPVPLPKFTAHLRDDLNITHKETRRGSEWRGVKLRIR
jgi:putative DNA primase/helicase